MKTRLALVLAIAAAAAAAWLWLPPPADESPGPGSAADPGVFTRGNGPEPESLDPHLARSESALNVLRDLYEGLTTLDARGRVIPGVAESWETSEDGLQWSFRLRQDARWSDGERVTAADFAWSFARLADPATGSPNALLLAPVRGVRERAAGAGDAPPLGVTAPGPAELVIRLAEPAPWLAEALAHPAASPVRRDIWDEHGRGHARPGTLVGNGAFRLAEWTLGSHVLLERNRAYWDDASTGVDQVRYVHLPDRAAELSRYRAGEMHMTYGVPVARFYWLEENMPEDLRVSPQLAVYFYGFNTRKPPLDDPRVRRALALAADRQLLTARVIGTGEAPACSLVPPAFPDYPASTLPGCREDRSTRLAEARGLLREAGYGPDNPLSLEIRYNTGEIHDRIAVAVGAVWQQELGVETELVREEFRVLLGNVRAGLVTEVYRASWIADFADPANFLQILSSDSPFNGTGWKDEEYDRLLEGAARAGDGEQRLRLLAAAEARMLEQAPVMPLYFYASKYLLRPGVEGVYDNPLNVHPSRFVRLPPDTAAR
ncbi:MAG: peptide ABC transporter substrate-binding protein [Gammaproteobacteria bacterium]